MALGQVSLPAFQFPLSVSFHHCSIFIHLPPTLYNVFLPVLQVSPVSIIPPLLHTHLYLNTTLTSRASGDRLLNVRISVQHWPQQYRNTGSCFGRQQTGSVSLSLLTHRGGASPASLRCECGLHVCPPAPLCLPLGSITHRSQNVGQMASGNRDSKTLSFYIS